MINSSLALANDTEVDRRSALNIKRRRKAVLAWCTLYRASDSSIEVEERYNQLLSAADDMEREALITSTEWRRFAQCAARLFTTTG